MTDAYSFPFVCHLVQTFKSGSINVKTQEYGPTMESVLVTLDAGKSSVNTGVYIPGIYRVNPYSVWKSTVRHSGNISRNDVYNHDTYYTTAQTLSGNPCGKILGLYRDVTTPAAASGLAAQALQKAYAKLSQSDLGLGEDLGELTETINMLRNPLSALREFLSKDGGKNLDKLNKLVRYQKTGFWGLQRGREAFKAASNTWLELRYGFRPLLYLLGDLMEMAEAKRLRSFDPNVIRSVRTKLTLQMREKNLTLAPWAVGWHNFHGSVQSDVTITCFASVQYRRGTPLTTLDKLGLSPRYWPETAWNLTKLSFVVDWLFTVGPWIQSFRHKPEITVLGNTVGTKIVREVTVKTHGYTSTAVSGAAIRPLSAWALWDYRKYSRVCDQSLPLTPLFTAGRTIDLFKAIDSVALIAQRLLR